MRPRATKNDVTDIIIPFHTQYHKVSRLIDSILKCPIDNPYHICLVDDGSPNTDFIGEIQELKVPYVTALRIPHQVGFAAALYHGYMNTKNPFVLFMHSDCIVEDAGWLRGLLDSYVNMRDKGVKLVSARTNNSTGGDPRLNSSRTQLGEDIIIKADSIQQILEEDKYCPLYCAVMHRSLFQRIGGFMKNYPMAYYEDVELAARMFASGFRQGISGRAYIHHDGGSTIEAVCQGNPQAKTIMELNFDRLRKDIKALRISEQAHR